MTKNVGRNQLANLSAQENKESTGQPTTTVTCEHTMQNSPTTKATIFYKNPTVFLNLMTPT